MLTLLNTLLAQSLSNLRIWLDQVKYDLVALLDSNQVRQESVPF